MDNKIPAQDKCSNCPTSQRYLKFFGYQKVVIIRVICNSLHQKCHASTHLLLSNSGTYWRLEHRAGCWCDAGLTQRDRQPFRHSFTSTANSSDIFVFGLHKQAGENVQTPQIVSYSRNQHQHGTNHCTTRLPTH